MSRLWHTNTHGIIVMYFVWAESAIVHGDFQQAQISFRLFWKRMLSSGTTICPNMQKEKKAPLVQICPKRKLLLLNARREEADFVSNYGYLQKMLKHEQSWICKKKQKTACVRTFRPRKMFLAKSVCALCNPPCAGGEKNDTLHSRRGQKRRRHCALVHTQR